LTPRTISPSKLFLRRFAKDKQGVAAVEFAMIAAPFFMILLGILEVAMIIFTSLIMENGVIEAAREIKTGQFQSTGGGEAEFKTLVCQKMTAVVKCGANLHVDVTTFNDFGSTSFTDPMATGTFGQNFGYNSAAAGQVVLVRVYYFHNISTPLLGAFFANYGSNKRIITWSAAFETEPF
jgi:Flp pilus assembly protein TadG